ncbi:MAG: hypothetical protein HKN13_09215 [Rhodothermales bacterium]|nr:hypothetical protein [Rhodothermales bacterium]
MRGTLVLINLDLLDDLKCDLSSIRRLGTIDGTLILPYIGVEDENETNVILSYHSVLRTCAELGMIAGCGFDDTSEKET